MSPQSPVPLKGKKKRKRRQKLLWRRIVKLSNSSLILFSFKYPFSLNLETDQEKDGINDTFPHGAEWDKPQCVVNQQCRDEKLADAQGIITENDLDIFRIIVEYLLFVNGKIIQ